MQINTVMMNVAAISVALTATVSGARAADITFLCAPALQPAVQILVPEFEKAGGHKVKIVYASIGVNATRVRNGEEADLAIVSPQEWQALQNEGKIASSERSIVAKVGAGVFVKKGGTRWNISSVDALKLTILQARSIAIGDLKTPVGAYMLPLFERLGIKCEIDSKLLLLPPGNPSPTIESVLKGDAEIGFSQMSEIIASPGVDALGPLPKDIQNFTTFTAAIPTQAKQAAAAIDLVGFLKAPESVAVFKSKGLDAD